MRHRYLMHVTLDTGHARRSYRDEVADAVVTMMGQDLAQAETGMRIDIRPGYALKPTSTDAALLATIESDKRGPIVTIAVVAKSRESAKMWSLLVETFQAKGNPPPAPWCAVKIHPAGALDFGAMAWLGDYERCVAWAWIERNGTRTEP